jgi:hypothetical protein
MGGGLGATSLCAKNNFGKNMKYYLFICIFFLFVNKIHSQIISNYGVKIGISYSDIEQDYLFNQLTDDTEFRFGFTGFLFAKSSFSKNIHIITELGYIQKGFQEVVQSINIYGEKDGEFTYKERFDYLTIKIQPCYEFELPSFTPYIFIGPKVDFKLNKGSEDEIITRMFRNTQFGLSYGIGIKLNNLFAYNLLLEINSNYDFKYGYESEYSRMKNISYEFKVGLEL